MMFFQMKPTKDRTLRKFPFNLPYKTQLLFVEVGFSNGEVENWNFVGLMTSALSISLTVWGGTLSCI